MQASLCKHPSQTASPLAPLSFRASTVISSVLLSFRAKPRNLSPSMAVAAPFTKPGRALRRVVAGPPDFSIFLRTQFPDPLESTVYCFLLILPFVEPVIKVGPFPAVSFTFLLSLPFLFHPIILLLPVQLLLVS